MEPYYMLLLHQAEPRKYRRFLLPLNGKPVANSEVIGLLPRILRVLPSRMSRLLAAPFQRHPLCRIDMARACTSSEEAILVFKRIQEAAALPILLDVSRIPVSQQVELKESLDLDDDDWYAVAHIRTRGYSTVDDAIHEYRNGPRSDLSVMAGVLSQLGGRLITVGHDVGPTDGKSESGVIPYSRLAMRSELNDLLICARCRFFIGNTSGAFLMAAVQCRPVLALNVAPLAAAGIWGARDLSIPMLYRDRESGDILTFREVFSLGAANFRDSYSFSAAGLDLVFNAPDDIAAGIREIALIADGRLTLTSGDIARQNRFRSLMSPRDYSFFSPSIVSPAFLMKFESLLD